MSNRAYLKGTLKPLKGMFHFKDLERFCQSYRPGSGGGRVGIFSIFGLKILIFTLFKLQSATYFNKFIYRLHCVVKFHPILSILRPCTKPPKLVQKLQMAPS